MVYTVGIIGVVRQFSARSKDHERIVAGGLGVPRTVERRTVEGRTVEGRTVERRTVARTVAEGTPVPVTYTEIYIYIIITKVLAH